MCSLDVIPGAFPEALGPVLKTTDWREVVTHPDVDIVVELVGGTTVAREIIDGAIANGKSVVTANKELMGACGPEIWDRAIQRRRQPGHGGQRVRAASPSTPCCARASRATASWPSTAS